MPLLAGRVYDVLGSHFWAFVAAGIACVIAMLLALVVRAPHHAASRAGNPAYEAS